MDNKLLTGIGILGIICIVLMSGCISEEKDLSEMSSEEFDKLSVCHEISVTNVWNSHTFP